MSYGCTCCEGVQTKEMAMCRGLLCYIQKIKPSPVMGIQLYEVKFAISGDVDTVQKHMLQEMDDVCEDEVLLAPEVVNDLMNDEMLDVPEMVASDCIQTCTSLPVDNVPAVSSRYARLTEEQIDDVAKSRLSVHTEKQTRWAVRLFKGK